MQAQYEHDEYGIVTVISVFSSHVNIMTGSGLKIAQMTDLKPITHDQPDETEPSLATQVVDQNQQSEKADSEKDGESETDDSDNTGGGESEANDSANTGTGESGKQSADKVDPNQVNINLASVSEINRKLPFIGAKRAKLIVGNRPKDGGYSSWEQFRQINTTLLDDEAAWAKLQELVLV
jgi:DNA uptake protein ComE-like DNA-binding protein